MLSRLLSPGYVFVALAAVLVAVLLTACVYEPQKGNMLVKTNALPPIDLLEFTRVETATFSLG